MVNMRQALGVDNFNQMSNYTGQLQNQRRSVGQKQYGLGGKVLDMAAALGDAYNQYQPPETALGMMALPAKAVYGLGNMIVQDVGDKTKSIMGTDRSNPAAMNQAATDAFGLAADTMAGGGVVSRMTDMPQGAILGANVFQGGPHKYGLEGAAESLKHIGKGEGVQAYGYGRYDAESKGVADDYRKNLSGGGRVLNVDGVENPSELLKSAMTTQGSPEEYIKQARLGLAHVKKRMDNANKKDEGLGFSEHDMERMEYDKRLKDIQELETYVGKDISFGDAGHIYKHDLPDEDIARYLDNDAPLSEQTKSVQDSVQKLYDTVYDSGFGLTMRQLQAGKDPTGREIYRMIGRYEKINDKGISETLAKAGIPGLKYFDGMSRTPGFTSLKTADLDARISSLEADLKTGLGQPEVMERQLKMLKGERARHDEANRTRNFVTWDQDVLNRMKLLERNNEDMTKALMPK